MRRQAEVPGKKAQDQDRWSKVGARSLCGGSWAVPPHNEKAEPGFPDRPLGRFQTDQLLAGFQDRPTNRSVVQLEADGQADLIFTYLPLLDGPPNL